MVLLVLLLLSLQLLLLLPSLLLLLLLWSPPPPLPLPRAELEDRRYAYTLQTSRGGQGWALSLATRKSDAAETSCYTIAKRDMVS